MTREKITGGKMHRIVDDDYIRGRVRRGYGNIFNLTSGSSVVFELLLGACITFEFSITDLKHTHMNL